MLHTKPICISHSLPYKWTLKRRRREAIQLRVFHFSFLPHIILFSFSSVLFAAKKARVLWKCRWKYGNAGLGSEHRDPVDWVSRKWEKCIFEKRERLTPEKSIKESSQVDWAVLTCNIWLVNMALREWEWKLIDRVGCGHSRSRKSSTG